MSEQKSRGQTIDEVGAVLRAADYLRLIAGALNSMADRTVREGKGQAYSASDSDDEGDEIFAIAERGKGAETLMPMVHKILAQKIDFVVEKVIGQPISTTLARSEATEDRPSVSAPPPAPAPVIEPEVSPEDEWYSDEERKVLTAKTGMHNLHGVRILEADIKWVRTVLEAARHHVGTGDPEPVVRYDKCRGRQDWRRKLFFNAVKAYKSRMGVSETEPAMPAPVVPAAPAAPPSAATERQVPQAAMQADAPVVPPAIEPERPIDDDDYPGDGGRRMVVGARGHSFQAPAALPSEQLQLDISADEMPDFLKREQMSAAPQASWVGQRNGLAYSETVVEQAPPQVGHAETIPEPQAESRPASAPDGSPSARPRTNVTPFRPRKHGMGFNVELHGDLILGDEDKTS